jgi:ABC-type oligopeptide transport system ATPase subunit
MSALVELKNVSKTFDVSAPWLNRVIERKPQSFLHAVSEVSFNINRGETLALVGESGCGKSTVARLTVGLYETSTGQVIIDGHDMKASNQGTDAARAMRRKVQMIFQDPYASLNPMARSLTSASPSCSGWSNSPLKTAKSIRTSSRVDNASASRLPAHWQAIRSF